MSTEINNLCLNYLQQNWLPIKLMSMQKREIISYLMFGMFFTAMSGQTHLKQILSKFDLHILKSCLRDAKESCQAIICYLFNLIHLLGKDLTLKKHDYLLGSVLLLVHLLLKSARFSKAVWKIQKYGNTKWCNRMLPSNNLLFIQPNRFVRQRSDTRKGWLFFEDCIITCTPSFKQLIG